MRGNLQAVRLNPGELQGMGTAGDFIPCREMAETVRRSGKMLYSSAEGSAVFSALVNLSILSTMARYIKAFKDSPFFIAYDLK